MIKKDSFSLCAKVFLMQETVEKLQAYNKLKLELSKLVFKFCSQWKTLYILLSEQYPGKYKYNTMGLL